MEHTISQVGPDDLEELLPLLRGYCDFYNVSPSDEELLALCGALIAEPESEGIQLLARNADGDPIGFATIYWTWSTLEAARLGVMNDLFVAEAGRGTGVAEELINACRQECANRNIPRLSWQTALDNYRAQKVYDRIGATREQWLDYWIKSSP